MTGYGRAEALVPGGRLTVEVRSVNHRYGELVIRSPRPLAPLDERVRAAVKEYIQRGRTEIYCNLELEAGQQRPVIDRELALAYARGLRELSELLGTDDRLRLRDVIALPEVIRLSDVAVDAEQFWPGMREALEQALGALVAMREREGSALRQELAGRIARLDELVEAVADRSGSLVEAYRQRLQSRLTQLAVAVPIDEQRLAMEVAVFADRSNIDEELVRARSHLGQFRACLEADEPVGRRLDFLSQELHREVNTIASKGADVETSQLVLALKAEIEKVREQVQNIE